MAEAGLIAHGRGEAFDYLLGEKTSLMALKAMQACAAEMIIAENPVISVNGNACALACHEIVELARQVDAEIEVNLFYHDKDRVERIIQSLSESGAGRVYGTNKKYTIEGLNSMRGWVDDALWKADTVVVMLEDGDRTEMMKDSGKKVLCIDLNPLSRSAQKADITIVDNVVRALPVMLKIAEGLREQSDKEVEGLINSFSQKENLRIHEELVRSCL